MTWVWIVLGIIATVVAVAIAGIAIAYSTMRRRHRRQLAVQAQQIAEFPAWADAHGYSYSPEFPPDDVERLRGLGPLMPFSEFAFARAEHVFRRTERGRVRYLLQLTIYADPGPTRAVSAMTVAVAEVARSGKGPVTDVRKPAASRGEPGIHAHGRWVTSYLGGTPLTLSSMGAVEERLEQHLRTA